MENRSMLRWIVDERWSAQLSPTEVYRVMHPPGGKYVALYVRMDLFGASMTENLGEFDRLEEAIDKAEGHAEESKKRTAESGAKAEPEGISSKDLVSKHDKKT